MHVSQLFTPSSDEKSIKITLSIERLNQASTFFLNDKLNNLCQRNVTGKNYNLSFCFYFVIGREEVQSKEKALKLRQGRNRGQPVFS